jgi:hypothetical protein
MESWPFCQRKDGCPFDENEEKEEEVRDGKEKPYFLRFLGPF